MNSKIGVLLALTLIPSIASADVTAHTFPDGHAEINVTGRITERDDCNLARAIVNTPWGTDVVINSKGGSTGGSLMMARIIGWSRRTAVVPAGAVAYSAAANILIGARSRRIEGDIGFHAPYLDHEVQGDPEQIRQGIANQIEAFQMMLMDAGLSQNMIAQISQTGPDSVISPPKEELNRAHGIVGDPTWIIEYVKWCSK